jgi:hypothetical protein
VGQLPPDHTVLAGFAADFLDIFPASPVIAATPEVAILSPKVSEDEQDGWALLEQKPTKTEAVAATPVTRSPKSFPSAGDDYLPTIATIARPEELTQRAPYWLVVRQETKSKVVINGSHGPSLACLDEYLKRWCRGNSNSVDRVSSSFLTGRRFFCAERHYAFGTVAN